MGPERRRPQVLDAAKAIALEGGGIPAITIGAVADRLGVTRPVVYACYPDRVALVTALLEREEQTLLNGVLAAYPTPRTHHAEEAFIAGMRALLRTVADQPDTWRMLFWSNPGPDIATMIARGRQRVAERFAALIAPDLQRWGTEDADRKLPVLVELFVSMGEAAVRSLLSDENDHTPDELGELVGRAAYRAIRHA
ncbi:TetR/AcrR family transcriptional regulator [Mycolicibacterium thermoresistibile]|nr:TetR/AcrR family transcriptional regulator [Mycolicibacterium thermoresistibile]